MLDFVYYAVSALLSFWHTVFAYVLGDPSGGLVWSLAVIFFVFTIRLLLVRPFVEQVRAQRITRQLQPRIALLRTKYAGDDQKLVLELRKLNKEHGVRPFAGCLPALVQAPVFIGLFHVLRSFDRTGSSTHVPFLHAAEPMTAAQNAMTPNYFFGVDDVQSFIGARVFGVPLSATITSTGGSTVLAVAIPLMVLAAVATFVTTRVSIKHRSADVSGTTQGTIMNRVMMLAPLGALIGGPFLPVAILIYFLANNAWTVVQQCVVYSWLPVPDVSVHVPAPKPKPGVRPDRR